MTDMLSKLDGRPEERCGLVYADGTLLEVENIHAEPEKGFHMNPAQVVSALSRGDVVGTWHTHPGADPNLSEEDLEGFRLWPHLQHSIIGVRDGKPTVVVYEVAPDGVVLAL